MIIRSYGLLVLLLYLAVVLQACVFSHLPWQGVKPDLLLVCVIVVGVLHGPHVGAGAGFWGGLLMFALVGRYPGSFLVSRTLTGFLAGWLEKWGVSRENVWIHVLAVSFGTFLCEGVFFILYPDIRFHNWGHVFLFEALYNTVLTPFVFLVFTAVRLNFGKD